MGNELCSKDGCENLALVGINWCEVHKLEKKNENDHDYDASI